MIKGRILHLQRLSTEDGPGIRTTVFFKGCPLHCAWCHNPESLSPRLQIQWFKERCLGCNTCIDTCPKGCLERGVDGLQIDRQACQDSPECAGTSPLCAEACPAAAIEALGKWVTVDETLVELLKDRAYYEKSAGGVTLSGGEPTLQPDFSEALLIGLHQAGISTALDTCGFCPPSTLERLLPHTDLVLFDLKLFDSSEHIQHTGQPIERILQNLQLIRDFQRQSGRLELWVRTPLIPGATDSPGNLHSLGAFLADNLDGALSRWELCAFNNLCRDKYSRLGMSWDYANEPLMPQAQLNTCESVAKSSGINPAIVFATGAVQPVVRTN